MWILTTFALLIPAFSLVLRPVLLPVLLRPVCYAPLPCLHILSFGIDFSPVTFSAPGHSTSELLRTL